MAKRDAGKDLDAWSAGFSSVLKAPLIRVITIRFDSGTKTVFHFMMVKFCN